MIPGDILKFRDYTIQVSPLVYETVSLFTHNASVHVEHPLVPVIPVVILSASSSIVGVCDDLILDGSGSSGSGGRDMQYNFSVAFVRGPSTSTTQLNDTMAFLADTNALHDGLGYYRTMIPSRLLPRGVVLDFRLSVTNFLEIKNEVVFILTTRIALAY